jgi:hypothetical protein
MKRSTSISSATSVISSKEKPVIMLLKNQSGWRWVVLVLGCVMMLGPYYVFDTPSALYTQLKQHMGNPDDYEFRFSLLYSLYSIPNVRKLLFCLSST